MKKLLLGLLVTACVLTSASFGRGLWIDEVIQFVLGSYDSTSEAWKVFVSTVDNINHGQTGTYFILNYWALKLFGASSFWIRFPSLVFGFFLFGSTLYLFDLWKVKYHWKVWGILVLFANPWLSYFIGEARAYMPLAACTVGSLAYYSTDLAHRKKLGVRFLAWWSVFWGVLFHPYFSIYWALTFLLGFLWIRSNKPSQNLNFQTIAQHLNVGLFVTGTLLYFAIGFATWISHPKHFAPGQDPLLWLPKEHSFPRLFVSTHFQALAKAKSVFFVLLVGTFFWFLSKKTSQKKNKVIYIGILVASGLFLSALLSYVSYKSNYWILQRQWIASIAIISLAVVAFAQFFEELLLNKTLKTAWIFFLFAFTGYEAGELAFQKVSESYHALTAPEPAPLSEKEKTTRPKTNGEWEELARANCREGGPVWKIFRSYYGKK